MKFIHCADLHLDSVMESLPSDKSKKRREELFCTFERLADYAEKNNVVAVIISGDMFDSSRVSLKNRQRVLETIKNTPNVDYLYLSGNHDDENFIASAVNQDDKALTSSSEKNNEILPPNLKIFDKNWKYFQYGNVTVAGIVLSEENSKYVYGSLELDSERINIVALHGQIVGYKSGEAAETISIPKLKDKNIDYLALGHIHSYAKGVIDGRGKYAYSGCPEGRGFDELGDKGFVFLETDGKTISDSFIKFSCRNLYEYNYDISEDVNAFETRNKLLSELKNSFSHESLIKVVLKGERSVSYILDKILLAERLCEDFFFVKVYDKTNIKVSQEDFCADKSVRGEFARVVLSSKLSDEEKGAVLSMGLNALNGEEIV